jgi:hypothetical protein
MWGIDSQVVLCIRIRAELNTDDALTFAAPVGGTVSDYKLRGANYVARQPVSLPGSLE